MPKKNNKQVENKSMGKNFPPQHELQTEIDFRVSVAMEMALEGAREAGTLGFYPHVLGLVTLPHSRPLDSEGKELNEVTRKNGNLQLSVSAGPKIMPGTGIPYGIAPRLILVYLSTLAKKRNSPVIDMGSSVSCFLKKLGMGLSGGANGRYCAVSTQLLRLLTSSIWTHQALDDNGHALKQFALVDELIWWNPREKKRWDSVLKLNLSAFQEMTERAIPLDLRPLSDPMIHRSPLAFDLYVWLPYRCHKAAIAGKEQRISWLGLRGQFGAGYAPGNQGMRNFRREVRNAIRVVLLFCPQCRVDDSGTDFIVILP